MDHLTPRLVLHPFTAEEALRVIAGTPEPGELWAPDYPFAAELDPLRAYAERLGSGEDQHPFTLYAIRERSDGAAIGGIGFFGEPDEEGAVELGYGLVPSARGRGFATEALRGAVVIARAAGAARIRADTDLDNGASRRVLEKAGFVETRRTDTLVFVELAL